MKVMNKIAFAKFPKIVAGNDCDGADILNAAGERIGQIRREIDWKDVGFTSCVYKAKITGYVVDLWKVADTLPLEPRFDTLAQARDYARKNARIGQDHSVLRAEILKLRPKWSPAKLEEVRHTWGRLANGQPGLHDILESVKAADELDKRFAL